MKQSIQSKITAFIVWAAALTCVKAQTFVGFESCKAQKADVTLWVPQVFDTSKVLASGSGSYAYGERGCKYFIADVNMATYSHSHKTEGGAWKPTSLLYFAGPYDLPSSASFGGTIPLIQEDCKRLRVTTKVYTKMHNQTSFTLRGTTVEVGSWSSGKCTLVSKSKTGASPEALKPSKSGWDTYRIVTRTKLRSTYQEVAVTFAEPPPG
jgi:hypothetical protein